MARFFDWTPDDEPASVVDVRDDAGWDDIRSSYSPGRHNPPLERIIEVAQQHGVTYVLVEYRYIDKDFRNEHSRFYSTTFRRYPSVCHRLHFFASDEEPNLALLGDLADAYRGYSVMRPLETSPVGRTMVSPPPELDGATVCTARDVVHLFGTELVVVAAPFTSQDEQYLRCAHASQWMVLYHAFLHGELPRRLPGDIQDASLGGVVVGRQVPSEGLSVNQMLGGLDSLGMSPGVLRLPRDRATSQAADRLGLFAIICRHVNSQMPPIVVSDSHAWVVVGYRTEGAGPAHDNTVLYRNDDAAGPYVRVDDPWNEPHPDRSPWNVAITTLRQKVYMTAERAEALGTYWLDKLVPVTPLFGEADKANRLTYRTYAIRSREYKKRRGPSSGLGEISEHYRMANWPAYVWVVEAIDRDLRAAREPCVLGEAIIDATAHHLADEYAPALLALHGSGRMAATTPDHEQTRVVEIPDFQPYLSACPAATDGTAY